MSKLFEEEVERAYQEQRIIIKTKRSYYDVWKAIDIFLRIITFGKQKKFMTHYTTTVGRTIYFPVGWIRSKASLSDYVTLCHERKHVWRMEKLGLGQMWLGLIIFGLLYFAVFLPVGLAWFRYVFEREAYLESFRACKRAGLTPDVNFYVKVLTGPDYVWTWPFKKSVRRWFFKHCV
jgi:hypothetical protein